jgi:hypothetical protein
MKKARLYNSLCFEVTDKKLISLVNMWGHHDSLAEVIETHLALQSVRVEWLGELRVVCGSSNATECSML